MEWIKEWWPQLKFFLFAPVVAIAYQMQDKHRQKKRDLAEQEKAEKDRMTNRVKKLENAVTSLTSNMEAIDISLQKDLRRGDERFDRLESTMESNQREFRDYMEGQASATNSIAVSVAEIVGQLKK